MVALDHVTNQKDLVALLVVINREIYKGKALWKEYFKLKVDSVVKKNVKIDKNIEEKINNILNLLNLESHSVFSKKLDAMRN